MNYDDRPGDAPDAPEPQPQTADTGFSAYPPIRPDPTMLGKLLGYLRGQPLQDAQAARKVTLWISNRSEIDLLKQIFDRTIEGGWESNLSVNAISKTNLTWGAPSQEPDTYILDATAEAWRKGADRIAELLPSPKPAQISENNIR